MGSTQEMEGNLHQPGWFNDSKVTNPVVFLTGVAGWHSRQL